MGHKIFFVRQVNDFAVSEPTKEVPDIIFSKIQDKLRLPPKLLGKLKLYNGMDIKQGKHLSN